MKTSEKWSLSTESIKWKREYYLQLKQKQLLSSESINNLKGNKLLTQLTKNRS